MTERKPAAPSSDLSSGRARKPGAGSRALKLYTDGAARGNPGPAGIGVVLTDAAGNALEEISEPLGSTTNNVAEYSALLRGLDMAARYKPDFLQIHSDSELMVRQLIGVYGVKADHLREYHRRAIEKLSELPAYRLVHVPRERNARADHLASSAASGKKPKARTEPEPGADRKAGAEPAPE